jgi:hypothetical protein
MSPGKNAKKVNVKNSKRGDGKVIYCTVYMLKKMDYR